MSKIVIENLRLVNVSNQLLGAVMQVRICSEDVPVYQRIYAEKQETVDWMLKFGSPFDMLMAGIIKIANEGKTGIWSLSATNTWKLVKYI